MKIGTSHPGMGPDLERLFRARGQIAVLRVLWKAPTHLTGRQVQHLAGVHNRTAMTCLADLESLGILQRRSAGRAYLYTLKRSHRIVRDLIDPVFAAEQAAPDRLRKALSALLKGRCLSAVLYGSVARSRAGSDSDVDLLVVVRDVPSADAFARTVQDRAERLVRDDWSTMLETNIKTRDQLVRTWNGRLMHQIRIHGRLVAGRPLSEIVHAGRT